MRIAFAGILIYVLSLSMLCVLIYKNALVNHHRQVDGLADQVVCFRNRLWMYYLENGRAPSKLSEVVLGVGNQRKVRFSTLQNISCQLDFISNARLNAALFHIRCGDPVLVDFYIGGDGRVLREVWYPHQWLRSINQKKVNFPRLTSRIRWNSKQQSCRMRESNRSRP